MIQARTAQTPADVAGHYDELDPIYRALWGEHVHHGLWTTGRETPEEAVVALSDRVGAALAPHPGQKLIDIGCGYGATAARLHRQFGAGVLGMTLSAEQATHAASGEGIRIVVRDWLDNGLEDASADGAYAVESTEHMADKAGFFSEAYRVLKPGGRLVVCAWLAAENASDTAIRHLLEPICREGRLPSMGTPTEYRALAEAAGFSLVDYEDVSRRVRRTWSICLRRLLVKLLTDASYLGRILDARSQNRIFAMSLPRLILAYRLGVMRYGIAVWQKPLL